MNNPSLGGDVCFELLGLGHLSLAWGFFCLFFNYYYLTLKIAYEAGLLKKTFFLLLLMLLWFVYTKTGYVSPFNVEVARVIETNTGWKMGVTGHGGSVWLCRQDCWRG